MKKIAGVLLAAILLAPPVFAQESFKHVWITQADSGEILRGRLVQLSPESLALLTLDNRRVEIPLDRVLRIEVRGDSLKNGSVIGAVIGAGLAALACGSYAGGVECIPGVAVEAGLGALIGAGVDAMNAGRTAIYSRPTGAETGKRSAVGFRIRF